MNGWLGRGRRRGFSLLEIMLVIAILSIGIMAYYSLIVASQRVFHDSAEQARADLIVSSYMEWVKGQAQSYLAGTGQDELAGQFHPWLDLLADGELLVDGENNWGELLKRPLDPNDPYGWGRIQYQLLNEVTDPTDANFPWEVVYGWDASKPPGNVPNWNGRLLEVKILLRWQHSGEGEGSVRQIERHTLIGQH